MKKSMPKETKLLWAIVGLGALFVVLLLAVQTSGANLFACPWCGFDRGGYDGGTSGSDGDESDGEYDGDDGSDRTSTLGDLDKQCAGTTTKKTNWVWNLGVEKQGVGEANSEKEAESAAFTNAKKDLDNACKQWCQQKETLAQQRNTIFREGRAYCDTNKVLRDKNGQVIPGASCEVNFPSCSYAVNKETVIQRRKREELHVVSVKVNGTCTLEQICKAKTNP